MEWYFVLLIAVACLGVGVGIGVGSFELGQWLYWRGLGAAPNQSIIAKGQNFAKGEEVKEGVDAVFVGDSITEGYKVNSYYPDINVVNRGISGDTTAGVIYRVESNISYLHARNVVLLIGINDLIGGVGEQAIFSNIKKILDIIADKCPMANVIVESIYPTNEKMSASFAGCGTNDMIDRINANLKAECATRGIMYVDVNTLLKDKDGMFKMEYSKDGVHASDKGYEVVTSAIRPLIVLAK